MSAVAIESPSQYSCSPVCGSLPLHGARCANADFTSGMGNQGAQPKPKYNPFHRKGRKAEAQDRPKGKGKGKGKRPSDGGGKGGHAG